MLNQTKFGTYIYAIGENRESARLSGVPIKKVEVVTFAISGMLAAFAGIVLSARMFSGQPSVGIGYELDAIAACVLGGVSMAGGVGRISGTIFGAIVIGIVSNGLNLINLSSFWQLIVKGIIILIAVIIDSQKGNQNFLRGIFGCRDGKRRLIGNGVSPTQGIKNEHQLHPGHRVRFYRKPEHADATGDAIPFYHEGKYHLFSQTPPSGTGTYPQRLRTTWHHAWSENLVDWEEVGPALIPGGPSEPDADGCWTGAVSYGEGKWHAFYTG